MLGVHRLGEGYGHLAADRQTTSQDLGKWTRITLKQKMLYRPFVLNDSFSDAFFGEHGADKQ